MPTYDYRLELTGEVFEVKHRMSEKLYNWGELCEVAGVEPGETPVDSPVTRILSAVGVMKSSSLKNPQMPPCMSGGGCSGGGCGV
ncbi:MAG: zinc ribbon domain-containing protein [Marinobacterium sp.]|nr:zinc ribbon domain-containing protein [Marinobacterium sp.]